MYTYPGFQSVKGLAMIEDFFSITLFGHVHYLL